MKKQIGEVGVDTGQILVCDPCYIDSQWKTEPFENVRIYRHNDGTHLQYGVNFENYNSVIIKYGKTMNQLLEDKQVVEFADTSKAKHSFSYNACCKKTLSDDDDGQLNYAKGHAGVGVVSNTGYGDGVYPVIADIDDRTHRVKSITIVFIDDDEDSDDSEERRDFGNDDDNDENK